MRHTGCQYLLHRSESHDTTNRNHCLRRSGCADGLGVLDGDVGMTRRILPDLSIWSSIIADSRSVTRAIRGYIANTKDARVMAGDKCVPQPVIC